MVCNLTGGVYHPPQPVRPPMVCNLTGGVYHLPQPVRPPMVCNLTGGVYNREGGGLQIFPVRLHTKCWSAPHKYVNM